MKRLLKVGAALGLLGMLGGCLPLPTPFTIASTALDVVLLVTTGKSSTDHLISAVMMKDCVLFRLLEGEEICIDELEEVPMQVPEDLYLRVTQPDGSVVAEKVTKIQPVHPISQMPRNRPAGGAMQEIPNRPPNGVPAGLVNPEIDQLPTL